MRPETTRTRPAPAPLSTAQLERLFGVEGMSRGRRIRRDPFLALLAPDLPVRTQIVTALKYVALGLVPPAVAAIAVILLT